MRNKPTIICLTPVRNEAWILEKFLLATSLWADHIIIADQNSTDETLEIAGRFDKVVLIKNDSNYDEAHRQKLLITAARKIDQAALLISLDADEFFTANFHKSNEWQTLLNMPKGSVGAFPWLDVHPDFKHLSHTPGFYGQWAFMDDGSDHFGGRKFHSHRIPLPEDATHFHFNDIAVLHYNYVDPKRNLSKRRWYMCLELLNYKVDALKLYKKYFLNHGLDRKGTVKVALEPQHLAYYLEHHIDMTSFSFQCKHVERLSGVYNNSSHELLSYYWWDLEVLDLIAQHGAKTFARLNIWNFNWELLAHHLGKQGNFKPEASYLDRLVLNWIKGLSGKQELTLIERVKFLLLKLLIQ